MDHLKSVPSENGGAYPPSQKDPVCGMNVDSAAARYQTLHNGKQYFFCSVGCLTKFQADPEKILSSPPKPMGSGLVTLGAPAAAPKTTFPTATANVSAPPAK